jgi:histidine triad (HIT) family protein
VTCVFCAIARGELPASLVHEDEHVLAFLDVRPVRPGHLLLVPRLHAARLRDLPDPARAHLWSLVPRLGEALRDALPADDLHVVTNDGPAASQTVPHVHVHLVPRRRGDALRLAARLLLLPVAAALPRASRADLDATAERLRARLRSQ